MSARLVALASLVSCLISCLISCLVACGSPTPQPSPIEARPRKPVENPPPPPKTEAEIEAVTRPLTLGPAADASIEDRRAAVLALLTDGVTAEHLSLDVTDVGVEFDPGLGEILDFNQPRHPQMQPGKITVAGDGKLDVDVLRRIGRAHYNAIRNCYRQALNTTPGAQGRLVVTFEITGEGKVEGPTISQKTIESERLEACVLEAVSSWKFPRPKGGALTASYPFAFRVG